MPNKNKKSTKQSKTRKKKSEIDKLIPYVSWSRIETVKSPKQYIERYLYDKKITSKAMEFGTLVTEALERRTDQELDEIMQAVKTLVPRYPKTNHEVTAYFKVGNKKIKYFGVMDGWKGKTKIPVVGEYKTSLYPWSKKKAQEHGQMKLYSWAHWKNTGIIPITELTWLETEVQDGEYALTGNFLTHKFRYTVKDMLEAEVLLIKSYKKIYKTLEKELSV